MFTFITRGHCDIVWYVESYKLLVLNSICKTNSLGARALRGFIYAPLPSSCRLFIPLSSSFFLFFSLVCLHVHFKLQSDMFSSAVQHLCPFIREGLVKWVGTLWRWMWWLVVQLGVAVVWGQGQLERSKVQDDGCIWQRPRGMYVWLPIMLLSRFLARLPFCHSPVTLFLPARKWLATLHFLLVLRNTTLEPKEASHTQLQHWKDSVIQLLCFLKLCLWYPGRL